MMVGTFCVWIEPIRRMVMAKTEKRHEVAGVLEDMKALFEKEGWVAGEEHVTRDGVYKEAYEEALWEAENMGMKKRAAKKRAARIAAKTAKEAETGYCLLGALKAATPNTHKRQCVGTVLDMAAQAMGHKSMVSFNDQVIEDKASAIAFIDEVLQRCRYNF
jgi:hypothetical protein